MALLAEWNIQSPAHACAATGRPFVEGEPIFTLLLQDRKGDWRRVDYAAAEWPLPKQGELISPLDEEGVELLSSWRSAYKPKPHAPAPGGIGAEALTKDNAEGLLRRLLTERNPAHANACYILALMLERKRMLKELDRREIEGQPCLIYEHLASGETWIIPNPPLRLDEIARIQAEVAALLSGAGTEAAPQPTPDPAPTEPAAAAEVVIEAPAEAEPASPEPAS